MFQTPAAVVVDMGGRANPASNSLTIEFPGHSTVGGIEIAGNLVPWGATLCLTPDDLISFIARCPTCVTVEGGCVYREDCTYQQFPIRYVEINAGVPAVTVPAPELETRFNLLTYDGSYMASTATEALDPYETRVREVYTHYEGPRLYFIDYWGPVTDGEHTLMLQVRSQLYLYSHTGFSPRPLWPRIQGRLRTWRVRSGYWV